MRIKIFLLAFLSLIMANEAKAINIFACEPEWAALAKEIGGDKIETFTATTAFQDAHYVQARPSLIANMRKADLVICSGAGLEAGWLPILFQKTGSNKIQVMAADYVETIEKPKKLDRIDGDVHPEGNPHLHLNPHNVLKVSEVLLDKLIEADKPNADFYENRFFTFQAKWNKAIENWEQKAKKLKDVAVISQHKNLNYLFDWLEIDNVANLEPKPGVPPTSKHLNELISIAKEDEVKLIIHTPFEDSKAALWLSKKTAVPALKLPYTVGGSEASKDLFGLFEECIDLMLKNIGDK